jgi:hypothetical protein
MLIKQTNVFKQGSFSLFPVDLRENASNNNELMKMKVIRLTDVFAAYLRIITRDSSAI